MTNNQGATVITWPWDLELECLKNPTAENRTRLLSALFEQAFDAGERAAKRREMEEAKKEQP